MGAVEAAKLLPDFAREALRFQLIDRLSRKSSDGLRSSLVVRDGTINALSDRVDQGFALSRRADLGNSRSSYSGWGNFFCRSAIGEKFLGRGCGGDQNVCFPLGTYQLVRQFGVRVAET